jgi:hypothetical protein
MKAFFHFFVIAALLCVTSGAVFSQEKPTPPGSDLSSPDKRVLGVLPNYRTAELRLPFHSITPKRKMTIAAKDSFDYPLVALSAIYASFYHLENTHPQFGQGFQGYMKRLGTSYTDQLVGNMLSEGILPSLFREDPRYFRMGEGKTKRRLGYAISRILITRTDAGTNTFNFAEVVGTGGATLVGWSYYTDARNPSSFFQAMATQMGTDALSQVLKEFWPDIKHHFSKKNKRVPSAN